VAGRVVWPYVNEIGIMKKITLLVSLVALVSLGSCARRSCPAYESNVTKKQPAPTTLRA